MAFVTIIIPFYRANNTIAAVLDALEDQTVDGFTVVLVDDSPEDRFRYDVDDWGFDMLCLQNEENKGLATSLARGIETADTDYVVTLHADCVPQSAEWLEELVSTIDEEDVGAVTSRVVIDFEALSPVNKVFSYIYDMGFLTTEYREKMVEVDHVSNKADIYRKAVLEETGGFSAKYKTSNEDTELSERIKERGHKLLRNNAAQVEHVLQDNERQGSIRAHLRKGYEYTRQTIYPFLDYGVTYKLDSFLATLSVLTALFSPVAAAVLALLGGAVEKRFFLFATPLFAGGFLLSTPELYFAGIGLAYLTSKGVIKGIRYLQEQRSIRLFLPIIFFTVLWEISTALGWLRGISSLVWAFKYFRRE